MPDVLNHLTLGGPQRLMTTTVHDDYVSIEVIGPETRTIKFDLSLYEAGLLRDLLSDV